jgi:hypothetical protein
MKNIFWVILSIVSVVVVAQQIDKNNQNGATSVAEGSLAQIACKKDYLDTLSAFSIETDGLYRIECNVEVLPNHHPKEYEGDLIQYFFDVNSDRKKSFDSKTDDRVFGAGQKADTNKSTFVFKQNTPHSAIYETFISWKKMGKQPKVGDVMGFDMAFSDNDGRGRETMLTWHAHDSELWINTSLFGKIKFVKNTAGVIPNDSVVYCVYSGIAPNIDGKQELLWQQAPRYAIKRLVTGTLKSPTDCKVVVRTVWNESGVYFVTQTTDDQVAFEPGPILIKCDYGWISNASGQKIWEVNPQKAQPAGGAEKNRFIAENVFLKAGQYQLHYVSDESNSPAFWDDTPPTTAFYGIRLLKR